MLAPFFIVVLATLASLVGADWIRHRDRSIVASFGELIAASREEASRGARNVTGGALAAGRTITAVAVVGIGALFLVSHFIG